MEISLSIVWDTKRDSVTAGLRYSHASERAQNSFLRTFADQTESFGYSTDPQSRVARVESSMILDAWL